jgi:MFS family permease
LPIPPGRPAASAASRFRALGNRNFLLWMLGKLVSDLGTWMQRTAQDWLVLVDLTHHSGLAVGVTSALQYLPMLLLSAHAGVLADRWPKRLVLAVSETAMGLSALALGLLVVTHTAQLWSVFLCATVLGLGSAFDNPTRLAFVSELVPRSDVLSAVSMNSTSANITRLIGPGLTGLVIARWGTGPAFLANAASFLAALAALALMSAAAMRPVPPLPRARGQVRAGISYVAGRPDLVLAFALTAVVATFGLNYQLTNALMATGAFHRGPEAYGLLGSMIAVGSLSGAVTGASRERPRLTLLIGATLAFGAVVTVSAFAPGYLLFAILLIPTGFASITFLNSANGSVQMSTLPAMRSRVLALYIAIRQGTTPLGAPLVGWLGSAVGARSSVLVGGVASLIAGAGAVALLRARPQVRHGYDAAILAQEEAAEPVPPETAS